MDSYLNKLDDLSGLNFKYDFSFAMAGHLLKGLRTSATKAATTRLLTDIIDFHCESNPAQILGYLAALMPISGDDVNSNLRQMYVYILILCCFFNSFIFFSPQCCTKFW